MPEISEIRYAKEIGRKDTHRWQWVKCLDCDKKRWVMLAKGKISHLRCNKCNSKITNVGGESHPAWKGGQWEDAKGYIHIWLPRDDFFFPMASKSNYVLEHRLVMAKHLGRNLQSWEKVHHKDGIKDHNEYNNLEMTTNGSHIIEHNKGYRDGYQQGLVDGRTEQIEELKREIKLLQWQVRQTGAKVI